LPIAFAVGITARKPIPTVANLPAEFNATLQPVVGGDWEYTDLFTNAPVRVHLLKNRTADGRFAVFLSADKDFLKPDLLVYWLPTLPKSVDTLPGDAVLLGGFGSTALPFPAEASRSDGVILLYSLADNEVVDVSRRIQFVRSTP